MFKIITNVPDMVRIHNVLVKVEKYEDHITINDVSENFDPTNKDKEMFDAFIKCVERAKRDHHIETFANYH